MAESGEGYGTECSADRGGACAARADCFSQEMRVSKLQAMAFRAIQASEVLLRGVLRVVPPHRSAREGEAPRLGEKELSEPEGIGTGVTESSSTQGREEVMSIFKRGQIYWYK